MGSRSLWGRLKTYWISGRFSLHQRLHTFSQYTLPVLGNSRVRWNTHAVPYIVADSDHDAAVLLGAVSQHLRGSQLYFLKKLAYGRLSEMAGPLFIELDYLIRMLDFHRVAVAQYAQMPDDSRAWLNHFVVGLNAVAQQQRRTLEERILGLQQEPWTVYDILTMCRMTGADVNWSLYFSLLQYRIDDRFTQWWHKLLRAGSGQTPHAAQDDAGPAHKLLDWINGVSRSGSNCLAVAGHKSLSGATMLAGDPHLGQQLPNTWLLVGIACPSFQVVGCMFPAAPVIGFGRNPHLAWGGTNLRAASSDVVSLDATAQLSIRQEQTVIACRGWRRVHKTIRWSDYGPIISDSKSVVQKHPDEVLALKWVGHSITDEFTAFYRGMKATTVRELAVAMRTAGVTPLNVLGADTEGHIAHMMAATLPQRSELHWDDVVISPQSVGPQWDTLNNCEQLPYKEDPDEGYLISANDKPDNALIGFFFNGESRVRRIRELLWGRHHVSVEDLKQLQTDVVAHDAMLLAHAVAEELSMHSTHPAVSWLVSCLRSWNGSYDAACAQALVFERALHVLQPLAMGMRSAKAVPAFAQEWPYLKTHLLSDLQSVDPQLKTVQYDKLAIRLQRLYNDKRVWGHMHRLELKHLLGHLPWLGRLFTLPGFAASGSRETVMKNSHGLVGERKATAYGSQARHISDMSGPDYNYFLILGGQDGLLGSQQFADQIGLWRRSEYIRMPLTPALIEREFPHITAA